MSSNNASGTSTNVMPSNRELTTDDIRSRVIRGRRIYGCPYYGCVYENQARKRVELHMEGHQPSRTSSGSWQCQDCTLDFLSRSALRVHRRTHTGERPFTCHPCGYPARTKERLEHHQERHNRHAWPCWYCRVNPDTYENLISHMMVQHRDQNAVQEIRRKQVEQHTIENRAKKAATGGVPKKYRRRTPAASQTGSAVLAAAAVDAAANFDSSTQAEKAAMTEREALAREAVARYPPCGVCGHVYSDMTDFQLHDCESSDELDERGDNLFENDADL